MSPPRLTLPFSTSACHSADIDFQNWYEESSGVQAFKKKKREKKLQVLKLASAKKPNLKEDYAKTVECVCACCLQSV